MNSKPKRWCAEKPVCACANSLEVRSVANKAGLLTKYGRDFSLLDLDSKEPTTFSKSQTLFIRVYLP